MRSEEPCCEMGKIDSQKQVGTADRKPSEVILKTVTVMSQC